jgi:PAS domain S-box-containing protein
MQMTQKTDDKKVKNARIAGELKTSENRYRRLFETAQDGILILNAETGQIMDVNPFLIKLLGYTREQFVDKAIWEIGTFKDIVANYDKFLELQEEEYVRYEDLPLETADGRKINVEFVSNVYLEKEHKVIQCNIRDITQRRQAEVKLNESLAKYQVLFDSFPLGITISDSAGKIVEANRKAEELLGLTKAEQLNRNIQGDAWKIVRINGSAFPPEEYASVRALKENRIVENVVMGIDKGKSGITWINVTAAPMPVKDYGVAIAYNDISERMQAEQDLLIAKEHAEECDLLKSAFLANMSHEIRTPMNGILGFTELLKEPDLAPKEQKQYLEIIENCGNHLLDIINDIVDISKIEAGQMTVLLSEINVNEKIEKLFSFFKPDIEAKGMGFLFQKKLPDHQATLTTDAGKINSIFTNLIKNAIKYSLDGSIELGYEKKGKFIEFFVKDTGMGIPADKLEAIFERFVQVDVTKRKAVQGSGLGLSISKAYVDMLGGKIRVTSKMGRGSEFYFTIPLPKN